MISGPFFTQEVVNGLAVRCCTSLEACFLLFDGLLQGGVADARIID